MSEAPELFPRQNIIGSFKGIAERGFEFAADLIIPYRQQEISQPQLGQFVLVELSNPNEAVLGRITKMTPTGLLASPEGEDYIERMRERGDSAPEDLKQRKLKYRVQVKLLGVLRRGKKINFSPSQRRLPHLGARVAWSSVDVLRELCNLGCAEKLKKTELGDFALGEFVYSGKQLDSDDSVHLGPQLPVTFNITSLIARRTAVFARAGYGKSNLIKFLVSELYKSTPKTEDGRSVGTLIFDADGEYFWEDKKGRPGLCDVPHLQDKVAVFSNRKPDRSHYQRCLVDGVKLNLKTLRASDVFAMALTSDRQEQQNVLKLKYAKGKKWEKLVDTINQKGVAAEHTEIGLLLGYKEEAIKGSSAEISAAISNLNSVVNRLHDPESRMAESVLTCLSQGKIVIVDISLLNAGTGEAIAGLLMRKIFSHNQEKFTGSGGSPLPVIAVIEEAQRVLGAGRMDESSPFVEWVKEGRKYDLGAVLVTQQPGALSGQLLSQTDNWFCFHLLSQGDAAILGKYNSHFSNDILAHMVAEPIIGNCYMWSAPHQPFVLPVRIREFVLSEGDAKKTADMAKNKKTPSEENEKHFNDNTEKMTDDLRNAICNEYKENKLGLQDFDNNLRGIKTGKLYHLIKDVMPSDEFRPVDDLKTPLFKKIFGVVQEVKKDGVVYCCAPKEKWEGFFDDKN